MYFAEDKYPHTATANGCYRKYPACGKGAFHQEPDAIPETVLPNISEPETSINLHKTDRVLRQRNPARLFFVVLITLPDKARLQTGNGFHK